MKKKKTPITGSHNLSYEVAFKTWQREGKKGLLRLMNSPTEWIVDKITLRFINEKLNK